MSAPDMRMCVHFPEGALVHGRCGKHFREGRQKAVAALVSAIFPCH